MELIIINQEQQDALLKVTMDSFKESGIRQAIRDGHKWWKDNILKGKEPYRVDRVSDLTYEVYIS